MQRTPNITSALKALCPTAEFGVAGDSYAGITWLTPDIPKPTEEAVDAEIARQIAEAPLLDCSMKAKQLISATDWSVLTDVGLANVSEFVAYRAALRDLIKNPVVDPVWPTEPQPVWA